MYIYLFILFYMIFDNNDNYKIVSYSELESHLNLHYRTIDDYDEQLKTNFGYIFRLDNGEVCFLPNDLDEKLSGIIFSTEKQYQFFLENDSLPIPNPNPFIFEKFKYELKDINKFISFAIEELMGNSILKENLSDIDFRTRNIEFLLQNARNNFEGSINNKFYYALVLGEYIRLKNDGKWLLLKKYGPYNYYYVPVVQYPNGNFVMILDRTNDFFQYTNVSLDQFLKLPDISSPYHNMNNTYAAKFIQL